MSIPWEVFDGWTAEAREQFIGAWGWRYCKKCHEKRTFNDAGQYIPCPCEAEWAAALAEGNEAFKDASPRVNRNHPYFKAMRAVKANGVVPLAVVDIEEPSE